MKSSVIALAVPAVIGAIAMWSVGKTGEAVGFLAMVVIAMIILSHEHDDIAATIAWIVSIGMPATVFLRAVLS